MSTETNEKENRGRPAAYPDGFSDEILSVIENAAGIGLSVPVIGALIGIGKTTFYRYCKEFPALLDRLEQGRAVTEFRVGQTLVNRAVAGDVQAIRWWEMTRLNRSEKIEVTENQTVVAMPAPVKDVDEWQSLAQDHIDGKVQGVTIDNETQKPL